MGDGDEHMHSALYTPVPHSGDGMIMDLPILGARPVTSHSRFSHRRRRKERRLFQRSINCSLDITDYRGPAKKAVISECRDIERLS